MRILQPLAALALVLAAACSGPKAVQVNALHVDTIEPDESAHGRRWSGRWQTNWGQLELFAADGQIRGAFRYVSEGAERVGLLVGKPHGNVLAFTWVEQGGTSKGRGRFVIDSESSKFSGMYGYENSEEDGGEWCGVRADGN